jgi:peptide/nickel transport system permease protein
MWRTIGWRALLLIPELLLVSVGIFLLVDLVPGDPAIQVLGPNSTQEEYVRVRQEMGLDTPQVEQYLSWLGDAAHGDLGRNLVPPVEQVSVRLERAFPVSVELAVLALAMALAVALPLAIWSAYKAGSRFDRAISAVSFGLISVPSFLAGIILLLIFAINWKLLPIGQWARPSDAGWPTNLSHALLPAITLALAEAPVFTRLLRADMISTLQEDYILAARAKGMPTLHVLLREALRPSSFSVVTLAGVSLGRLIGGTVVIETVFGLPGVGRTIVEAATRSDYKVVQGGVLVIAVVYVALNLLIDTAYTFLDPRLRRGRV